LPAKRVRARSPDSAAAALRPQRSCRTPARRSLRKQTQKAPRRLGRGAFCRRGFGVTRPPSGVRIGRNPDEVIYPKLVGTPPLPLQFVILCLADAFSGAKLKNGFRIERSRRRTRLPVSFPLTVLLHKVSPGPLRPREHRAVGNSSCQQFPALSRTVVSQRAPSCWYRKGYRIEF
jgi:hypothetical protein